MYFIYLKSSQGRARQLYTAGYKTLQLVAHADAENIVREINHMPRKIAKQIIAAAKVCFYLGF